MENNIYTQNICGDCLQSIVNGDNERDIAELNEMNKTIEQWSKEKYFPLGLTENTEPFFSHSKCDLCDQLAGQRYEYYFIDKSNNI